MAPTKESFRGKLINVLKYWTPKTRRNGIEMARNLLKNAATAKQLGSHLHVAAVETSVSWVGPNWALGTHAGGCQWIHGLKYGPGGLLVRHHLPKAAKGFRLKENGPLGMGGPQNPGF